MGLGQGWDLVGLRPAPASVGLCRGVQPMPILGMGDTQRTPSQAWEAFRLGDQQCPAYCPGLGQPSLPCGLSRQEGCPACLLLAVFPMAVLSPLKSTVVLLAGWFTLQV